MLTDPISTYQVKGGETLYNVNENLGVFINSGYVQKVLS